MEEFHLQTMLGDKLMFILTRMVYTTTWIRCIMIRQQQEFRDPNHYAPFISTRDDVYSKFFEIIKARGLDYLVH